MSSVLAAQAAGRQIEHYAEQIIKRMESLSAEDVWAPGPGGANAIGTLAHHLSGNLRHYLGAGALQDGYKRDRQAEFADREVPPDRLADALREAAGIARRALESVDAERWAAPHTAPDGRAWDSLGDHVIMLLAHFAYHAGQVDYAARG